jgi:hypothetical protein
LDGGARPAVTLALDGDNPLAEAVSVRLYAGTVSDETLMAEGSATSPATASLTPDQGSIVAVVEATENRLRGLGLSDDHRIAGTLTNAPHGPRAEIAGEPEPVREPTAEAFALRARVYEPFDPMPRIYGVVGVLALVLLGLAVKHLRPGLPADAVVSVDGGEAPLPPGGGTVGGPAATADIGASGQVGAIKGRIGGRRNGNATFRTDQPVDIGGVQIPAGKTARISPGTTITPQADGNPFVYERSAAAAGYGFSGDGFDDGGD